MPQGGVQILSPQELGPVYIRISIWIALKRFLSVQRICMAILVEWFNTLQSS
jgi:hypothetical protein